MAHIVQTPAALALQGVAGDPFSLTLNVTVTDANDDPIPWSDVTDPTVVVVSRSGMSAPLYQPTVSSPSSGVLAIAWTAAQTLGAGRLALSWSLQVTINGVGPLAVAGGSLRMTPPYLPGRGGPTSADLVVQVGTATVDVGVQVGAPGAQGPQGPQGDPSANIDGGNASSNYVFAQTIDGGGA
jgi:hypothetical protein